MLTYKVQIPYSVYQARFLVKYNCSPNEVIYEVPLSSEQILEVISSEQIFEVIKIYSGQLQIGQVAEIVEKYSLLIPFPVESKRSFDEIEVGGESIKG